MIEKMIVKVVGNYSENDWQNNRTGEKKLIKSIQVVLKNGREGYVAEASGELAEKIRDMKLKVDTPVLVNLSFDYQEVTKDNVVRYFQRVRIEDFVPLAF
jgi:hypothetical protein